MKSCTLTRLALCAFVLTLLPSCGSDFRSAWKKAPAAHGATGKWEGTWLSAANGHHGKLRCVVAEPGALLAASKLQPNAVPHTFHYRATWMKILSGSYTAVHNVQKQKDGTYVFKGEHKMPDWAGGLYHYEGTIKDDEFKANYRCSMDHGTYTMKRVR